MKGVCLLMAAGVRLALQPVGAQSLPVHVSRCKVGFYAFQSCREWKKRALKYGGKIRPWALLPDIATLAGCTCHHHKALEKSRTDAEKAERH